MAFLALGVGFTVLNAAANLALSVLKLAGGALIGFADAGADGARLGGNAGPSGFGASGADAALGGGGPMVNGAAFSTG